MPFQPTPPPAPPIFGKRRVPPLTAEQKAALVAKAEARGVDLPELTLAEMQAVNPAITSAVFDVLGVHNSVASRQSYGGTAPDQVRSQVARWRKAMEAW